MRVDEYLRNKEKLERNAKAYQTALKNAEKIKRIALKVIYYPEMKEAYDYVDNLFPSSNVKNIKIYKVSASALEKMGYGGAGGLYGVISGTVVLSGLNSCYRNERSNIIAKVSADEVVVHELCHYVCIDRGMKSKNVYVNEEFAYGWSIGYLRSKGYSDEYIVKYNFLPYFFSICNDDAIKFALLKNGIRIEDFNNYSQYRQKEFYRINKNIIFNKAKEMGENRAWEIIRLYSNKISEDNGQKLEEVTSRFSLLDFGE